MVGTIEVDFDDLTRSIPGQSLTQQLGSRSCTAALLQHNDLNSMVGQALVIEVHESEENEIPVAALEQAMNRGWENAERIAKSAGGPIQLPERLLVRTSKDDAKASMPLSMESVAWLARRNFILIGTDCPRLSAGDEDRVINFLADNKITFIVNLDLRGITSGATYRMAGSAPLCPSAGFVPARVLLMY